MRSPFAKWVLHQFSEAYNELLYIYIYILIYPRKYMTSIMLKHLARTTEKQPCLINRKTDGRMNWIELKIIESFCFGKRCQKIKQRSWYISRLSTHAQKYPFKKDSRDENFVWKFVISVLWDIEKSLYWNPTSTALLNKISSIAIHPVIR